MGFFISQSFIVSLSILCLIITPSPLLASQNDVVLARPTTVYELLESFDFPSGILPQGVVGYDLDPSTGKFAAYFNGSCGFSLEGSYQLNYKSAIRGFISKGELSGLEGVSVKLFWFWVDIIEVKRSGDDLEFSVGIAAAGFPLDNFEESPQCGCGFNCNGVQVRKLNTNVTVSSY